MRKTSRKGLIKKLDQRVSIMVRSATPYCVLCGSRENLTAGHVFSRVNYSTRWDFDNVFTQCIRCNYMHEQDAWPYYKWYIDQFGEEKFEALRQKHHQTTHLKDFDLEEKLALLVNQNSSLENRKTDPI